MEMCLFSSRGEGLKKKLKAECNFTWKCPDLHSDWRLIQGLVSFQNEAPGDYGLTAHGEEAKVSSDTLGVSAERQDTTPPGQDNR